MSNHIEVYTVKATYKDCSYATYRFCADQKEMEAVTNQPTEDWKYDVYHHKVPLPWYYSKVVIFFLIAHAFGASRLLREFIIWLIA